MNRREQMKSVKLSTLLFQHAQAFRLVDLGSLGANSIKSMVDSDKTKQMQRLVFENAALVALKLTQCFSSLCCANVRMSYFSSMKMDDFHVTVEDSQDGDGPPDSLPTLYLSRMDNTALVTSINSEEIGTITALEALGRLFCGIFYCNMTMPNNLFEWDDSSAAQPPLDIQNSRRRRVLLDTLFARLVESGLPPQVGRLLSDMISGECPIESFDSVEQDLRQMIAYPDIFLHHPGAPTAPFHFGEQYYGRGKERHSVQETIEGMGSKTKGVCTAIFVSGTAGSGKTQLVKEISAGFDQSLWTIMNCKFQNDRHMSGSIVFAMFDNMLMDIARMKSGNRKADADYAESVIEAVIAGSSEAELIHSIGESLPTLPLILGGPNGTKDAESAHTSELGDFSHSRIIFGLSQILKATLHKDRRVMMFCDDLQWCDKSVLSLIFEVLTLTGEAELGTNLLFFGCYREEAIYSDDPMANQLRSIRTRNSVDVSEIRLKGLTLDDVVEMLMFSFGLPRRYVVDLALEVLRKTTGHALYVVQLLNLWIQSSVIFYGVLLRRYLWDIEQVMAAQTSDTVAGLIASKVEILPDLSKKILRILSCFGAQLTVPLIEIIERFQPGILDKIDDYVSEGILHRQHGTFLVFSHDLILQSVVESMSKTERQNLHKEIGMFFLRTAETSEPERQLFGSTLRSIACNQLNMATVESFGEPDIESFAILNLSEGKRVASLGLFEASSYHFAMGLHFLGEDISSNERRRLYIDLCEGMTSANFLIGEYEVVESYANKVKEVASFEESLKTQNINLKALTMAGKYFDCVAQGFDLLKTLGVSFPEDVSDEDTVTLLTRMRQFLSTYKTNQLIRHCDMQTDESDRIVLRILDAIQEACYSSSPQFIPYLSQESIRFSLERNFVCPETALAFALYSSSLIQHEQDFVEAKRVADISHAICKKVTSIVDFDEAICRCEFFLAFGPDIWGTQLDDVTPRLLLRELSQALLADFYKMTKFGAKVTAGHYLWLAFRYAVHSGSENLFDLAKTYGALTNSAVSTRGTYTDGYFSIDFLLLEKLTGERCIEKIGEGINADMEWIERLASETYDPFLSHDLYTSMILPEFMTGMLEKADEYFEKASISSAHNQPFYALQLRVFSGGLVKFHMFLATSSVDEKQRYMARAKELMSQYDAWANISMAVFEARQAILQALYLECLNDAMEEIESAYETAIDSAHHHGNIVDLAYAYFFLARYETKIGRPMVAKRLATKSYAYFRCWGANALVKVVKQQFNLSLDGDGDSDELITSGSKRSSEDL